MFANEYLASWHAYSWMRPVDRVIVSSLSSTESKLFEPSESILVYA